MTIADIADREVVKKAQEFGIDLTLTNENLSLTPAQRLKKLQEFVTSLQRMRGGMKNR